MSVIQSLEALPTSGLTITLLQSLDKVVPGQWQNVTRFEQVVASVAEVDKPGVTRLIAKQAAALEKRGHYGKALQVYQMVDKVDQAAAGVAVAGKITDLFGSLAGLKKFTPKPETTQAVDAGLKLVAELVAFGLMNGMPTTGKGELARFVGALEDYGRYDLMRIASWVVVDGLLPLGPNFLQTILGTFQGAASSALTKNPIFDTLGARLPGANATQKQAFIVEAVGTTGEWVSRFVKDKGLTQAGALKQLEGVLSVAEGGGDYVAAAIDASTNYYSHTGTQTVARTLATHAKQAIQQQVWQQWAAGQN